MNRLQLKFLNDSQPAGTFTGLASTPTRDRQNDIVLPGAFKNTLAAWQSKNYGIPMLWQHDQTQQIGVINHAAETPDGLQVTGRILTTSAAGAHAYALAQAGSLHALSIGYTVSDGAAKTINGIRHLSAVELHEVSAVSIGANSDARITSIKSAADCNTIREYEALVREALGLSSRTARAVASKTFSLVKPEMGRDTQRDVAPETVSQALAILQRSSPHL